MIRTRRWSYVAHDRAQDHGEMSAGIGFAIAEGLAKAGATVVVNGRTQPVVDAALATSADFVPRADSRGVAADIATPEGCAALVAAEPMADILVNNVGIYGPQDFFEIPDAEWTPYCPKTAWQVP